GGGRGGGGRGRGGFECRGHRGGRGGLGRRGGRCRGGGLDRRGHRRGRGGLGACGGRCRRGGLDRRGRLELECDRLVRLAEHEGNAPLEIQDDAYRGRVELRRADAHHGRGTREHVGQGGPERGAGRVDVDARRRAAPGREVGGRGRHGRGPAE